MFVSSNNGMQWTAANTGLASTYINALAVVGTDVFAGFTGGEGLCKTSNDGELWTLAGTGLGPDREIRTIAAGPTHLYAGTRGRGVWRRPLSEIVTSSPATLSAVPAAYALEQNYPNPFNPTTVVRYQLPEANSVKIDVLDLLGREQAVLVDEWRSAGSHDVEFDATGLSTGVYFYRLTAGDYTQTRRMILLR